MLHIKFGFGWPSGFREEELWTDDGRTTDHGHPISSPCEPNGSGELKIGIPLHTPVLLYKSGVQGRIHYTDMFY